MCASACRVGIPLHLNPPWLHPAPKFDYKTLVGRVSKSWGEHFRGGKKGREKGRELRRGRRGAIHERKREREREREAKGAFLKTFKHLLLAHTLHTLTQSPTHRQTHTHTHTQYTADQVCVCACVCLWACLVIYPSTLGRRKEEKDCRPGSQKPVLKTF